MTDQPFSRPGAVDLTKLGSGPAAATPGAAGGPTGSSAYATDVDEQSFQALLEQSMTAPVLLSFYSPTRAPQTVQLVRDLETLAGEMEGKFLLGKVDIDTHEAIAQAAMQAMQAQTLPLVALVAQGRPMPLLQDAPPLEELRAALTQIFQQLATQGFTGRHQPLAQGGSANDDDGERPHDPRYAPAEDALVAGDVDLAIAEYQKLVDANPADSEAGAGLARSKMLKRTQGVDLDAARADAAARPDDVDAQTLCADLDLFGGHVDDAFDRLIALIRRTTDDDRNRAREHLIGLFAAVGNDDPRVARARRDLASALF